MKKKGEMRLTKHHGAGNDFLVILDPDDRRPLSAAGVRVLCDRHRGIGADGVLRVMNGRAGAVLSMELRNADGGAAEMSGNGIRCLVQAAVDARWVAPGPVSVATAGGIRTVVYRAGDRPGLGFASVDMGVATLGPDLDPDKLLDGQLPPALVSSVRFARTVDMGNPHIVLFGDEVDDDVVATIGPRLEHSLEARANVEFAWATADGDDLTLRVWERGVGETLACGTGACAVAAAAHSWGLVGSLVRVHNPGGTLEVEIQADGISLAGPTQKVADIVVDAATMSALASDDADDADDARARDGVASGP
jgi:diaminopimelate epimerase